MLASCIVLDAEEESWRTAYDEMHYEVFRKSRGATERFGGGERCLCTG